MTGAKELAMTLAIVWYRERFDAVWAVADTRISRPADDGDVSVLTDSGPKIYRIPVYCTFNNGGKIERAYATSFGFVFAGYLLSALSTHAFASTCTENLYSETKRSGPPSLVSVAELYRKVGERYVKEICSRLPYDFDFRTVVFQGIIFGFCPRQKRYAMYQLEPLFSGGTFSFARGEAQLEAGRFFPIGSGTQSFVEMNEEMHRQNPTKTGVMITFERYLQRQPRKDVGGHFQIGVCDRQGFGFMPVLTPLSGEDRKASITHLGVELADFGDVDGYSTNSHAVGPDPRDQSTD